MSIEQGDLFWYDFGPRQDHLQEGPRPVLVVQSNGLNVIFGYPNVIIVPVTTKEKQSATYAKLEPTTESGLDRISWAIGNQLFTIDKGRLGAKLGHISRSELYVVKECLRISLAL